MSRFLLGLLLVSAVLALGIWIGHIEGHPQTDCPPHENANPWCQR